MSLRLLPIPDSLFRPETRHVVVVPHQDDEAGYLGLISRLQANAHALWVTNGDGLAPSENADPLVYASMRESESRAAMRIAGFADSQLEFLGHSEIAIYDDLKAISQVPAKEQLPTQLKGRLLSRAAAIRKRIDARVANADAVWTVAFQGGHVEHDLTHYLTWKAVQAVRKAGRDLLFYELPEYEIMFFVPLRFPPWKRGVGHVIELSDEELLVKERAMSAYPSQMEIIRSFKKLMNLYGAVSALRLRPFDSRGFSRLEYFGPVPADRSYVRSPHGFSPLDYIREYHDGARIAFDTTLARWIALIEAEA